MVRVCVLEVWQIKCKKAYFLKEVEAHHDHQDSAQEKEKPENVIRRDITPSGNDLQPKK